MLVLEMVLVEIIHQQVQCMVALILHQLAKRTLLTGEPLVLIIQQILLRSGLVDIVL